MASVRVQAGRLRSGQRADGYGELDVRVQFAQRRPRDREEAQAVARCVPPFAFRQVRVHRNRRAPHLITERAATAFGYMIDRVIYRSSEKGGLLADAEPSVTRPERGGSVGGFHAADSTPASRSGRHVVVAK